MRINWGKRYDIEVAKFPETEQNARLVMEILSISVCDDEVDLVWRVICKKKVLQKRCSRNSALPLFQLKLKSPAKNVTSPSALIFERSDSRNSLLNLCGFIDGCLQMLPSNELGLFGIVILIILLLTLLGTIFEDVLVVHKKYLQKCSLEYNRSVFYIVSRNV